VRNVKIGTLVSGALLLLMVTIFSLGQQQLLWSRKVEYDIHLARTGGLQEGAPVSLTGVPIGSVAELRFPSDPAEYYIEVTVRIDQRVAPRIRENTIASVRTFGLLGDRYIELSAGSPDSPPLPAGGLIASMDPVDYEAVLGQSGDIVTNVVEVTASLKTVLQAIERGEGLLGAMVRNKDLGESTLLSLERTMSNLQETTREVEMIFRRVSQGQGLLGRLTRDTKEGRALLASIERSASAIEEFTGRLNRSRGLVARMVEDEAYARRVLENLDRTAQSLADVGAKLERGEGTLGLLLNDPSLYQEARGLLGRARRNWLLRLFGFGGGPVEPSPATPEAGGVPATEPAAASAAPAAEPAAGDGRRP
jgi:phospholipid/cholesterol/gamma-HCH transport system substrate-binding protein